MIKNKNPKISIIMPVFNARNYIVRSIESIVSQNYNNYELIIQDGESSDGTLEIIKDFANKYSGKIKWSSKKDKGQADAINIGLKRAKGEILTYLNADDIYKEGALRTVGNFFVKNPKIMWAYGMCDIINSEDKKVRSLVTSYKNFWLRRYSYSVLLTINYISQMGVFWRSKAYKEIGDFDVNEHYVMDYDYWLRLGKKYQAGFMDDYLASFRIVPTTKSSTGFKMQFKDEYNVVKKYTKDKILLSLHYAHSKLIIWIYLVARAISNYKLSLS